MLTLLATFRYPCCFLVRVPPVWIFSTSRLWSYFSKVTYTSVLLTCLTNEVFSRLLGHLYKGLKQMPGQIDLGFDNMLWKMNLECVWKKIYATLEPLHKYGPMCVIRGQTCLWECILMAFAHLKLDTFFSFFRCIYDAFYLFSVLYGSIAFFVFLSRPFFPN